jgi:two-component system sensor histidine kinase DegS
MSDPTAPSSAPTDGDAPAGTLADRLAEDLARLDTELGEIDLLIAQAKAEAGRHESRRTAAAEKLAALSAEAIAERLDQTTNLVTLNQRSALMDTQVEVLEGKRRALARYRDAVAGYMGAPGADAVSLSEGVGTAADAGEAPMPPAVSRLLLTAQEDLRREIARAMHDGPAQSLTNIVLQAQIVERLVDKDPTRAADEVRQLIAMVQQTLEATKSFIFDVRPMVLDDLGLVPTLRRSARDRGGKAGVAVEFDSLGQDRRLPMDLESGLFRMLDEALAAYLSLAPERVTLKLDWGEQLEARLTATRTVQEVQRDERAVPASAATVPSKELPPALAAMMEDRLADEREAQEAAERDALVILPPTTWREIQDRAASVGVTAELLGQGGELRLVADLPAPEAPAT